MKTPVSRSAPKPASKSAPKSILRSASKSASKSAPKSAPKLAPKLPPGPVWGNFDQDELDRQYNSRATVPDFTVFTRQYAELTTAAKAAAKATADSNRACVENLRYGPGDDETFDFYPAATGDNAQGAAQRAARGATQEAAPVMVFLHGGDWRTLSKDDSGFAAPAFTAAGVHFIALNFSLVPTLTVPQMGGQVRDALAWIAKNIGTHGGDPKRIFIAGHSSGANLVAQLLITDWAEEFSLPPDLIKGATFISGLGDLEPVRLSFRNGQLKLNKAMVEAASLLNHAPRASCPLLVAFGANEMREYHRQGQAVAAHWRRHGLPVQTIKLAERNHFDAVLEWADPASALFQANLAMIQSN